MISELIIYRKPLVNNKSSTFHLRREQLQPNKINQHKAPATARRLNREHSRFKTIDETLTHQDQQLSNEANTEKFRINVLTKENLKDYSESEEDFSIRRILEWVDTAATGKDALQQVHYTLGNSPEFVEANAIVVVFEENSEKL